MSLIYRKVSVRYTDGTPNEDGILVMSESGVITLALVSTQESNNFGYFNNHIIGCRNCVGSALQTRGLSFATVAFSAERFFAPLNIAGMTLIQDVPVETDDVIDLREILAPNATICAAEVSFDGVDNEISIKSGYTTTDTYSGFGGYHTNQRTHRFNVPITPDKPWRIGVELEVYARSREDYNKITSARSNWFQCESDSSLHDGAYGGSALAIELKTIPLRACDAKSVVFWQAPLDKLKAMAKSKGSVTTGLHVHIGKEALGDNEVERQKTLAKLNLFYVYMVEDDPFAHSKNVIICGREHGYAGSLASAKSALVDNAMKWGCLDKINEVGQTEIGNDLRNKCRAQRWDINIGPYDTYGTIEFRKGKGIISKIRMAAVVTWWEQMVLYCRQTPWNELNFNDFFNKVTSENPCVAHFFTQDEEA